MTTVVVVVGVISCVVVIVAVLAVSRPEGASGLAVVLMSMAVLVAALVPWSRCSHGAAQYIDPEGDIARRRTPGS
jgi:hypothetical protein